MESSTKIDAIKSGWSKVYNKGLHVITIFQNTIVLLSFKVVFGIANSADTDEMHGIWVCPDCKKTHL